jgi:hypothetical protein
MSSELKDSIETYQSLKVICLAAKKMASINPDKYVVDYKIPEDLQNELTEIIKYRDKLAHGKRFHEKLKPTKLEDVLLTLENILDEI